jgi:DNA-directed RNA polymerase omega subunit
MSMTTSIQKPVVASGEKNGGVGHAGSIYRLIILAGLRSKQLVRGSLPRIKADPLKRKNTSIALEELRQGLVSFTVDGKGAVVEDGATS